MKSIRLAPDEQTAIFTVAAGLPHPRLTIGPTFLRFTGANRDAKNCSACDAGTQRFASGATASWAAGSYWPLIADTYSPEPTVGVCSGRYEPNVQGWPSVSRTWYSREPKSVSVGELTISAPADRALWKCTSTSSP